MYRPLGHYKGMRIPSNWREPLARGRLLLLSPFNARRKRPTADLAKQRNRFVAALADAVFVAHASPGGKTESLCREIIAWSKPLWTVPGPENANLLALGAKVSGQEEAQADAGAPSRNPVVRVQPLR